MTDTQELRACPACANAATDANGLGSAPATWQLASCRACGFVYLQNPVSYDALEEEFAWEKQISKQHEARRKNKPVKRYLKQRYRYWRNALLPRKDMQMLISQYAPAGNVIDIGCGAGDRLMQLSEAYTPYGIEISKALAEQAHARLSSRGGACWQQPALEGLKHAPEGHFTGASLRSYLEHEVEPKPVLQALSRAMKPGGIVIIKVPNYACWNRKVVGAGWSGFRFPDHVNYFTPDSLRQMVNDTGFTVKRFRWYDRLPISDNMWMVAQKR